MGGFRRFLQLVLSPLSLVALLCAASLFYRVPELTEYVWTNLLVNHTLHLALFILILALFVYALCLFLSALFTKRTYLHVKKPASCGDLVIAREAVMKLAEQAAMSLPQIYEPKADVIFYQEPSDMQVKLYAKVQGETPLIPLGSAVQSRIIQAIKDTLAIEMSQVDVKLSQADLQKMKHKTKGFVQKAPRVQ